MTGHNWKYLKIEGVSFLYPFSSHTAVVAGDEGALNDYNTHSIMFLYAYLVAVSESLSSLQTLQALPLFQTWIFQHRALSDQELRSVLQNLPQCGRS